MADNTVKLKAELDIGGVQSKVSQMKDSLKKEMGIKGESTDEYVRKMKKEASLPAYKKAEAELRKVTNHYKEQYQEAVKLEKKITSIANQYERMGKAQQKMFEAGKTNIGGVSAKEYSEMRKRYATTREGLGSDVRKMASLGEKGGVKGMIGELLGAGGIARLLPALAPALILQQLMSMLSQKAQGYRETVKGNLGYMTEMGYLADEASRNKYIRSGAGGLMSSAETIQAGKQMWGVGMNPGAGDISRMGNFALGQGIKTQDYISYMTDMKKALGSSFNYAEFERAMFKGFNRSEVKGRLEDYMKTNVSLMRGFSQNQDMTNYDMRYIMGMQKSLGRAGYEAERGATAIQSVTGAVAGNEGMRAQLIRKAMNQGMSFSEAIDYAKNPANQMGLLKDAGVAGKWYAQMYGNVSGGMYDAMSTSRATTMEHQDTDKKWIDAASYRRENEMMQRFKVEQEVGATTDIMGGMISDFTSGVITAISSVDKFEINNATLVMSKVDRSGFGEGGRNYNIAPEEQ